MIATIAARAGGQRGVDARPRTPRRGRAITTSSGGAGQLRERAVRLLPEDLAAVPVDEPDVAAVGAAERAGGDPLAPFRRVVRGAEHGDRAWIEERAEIAHAQGYASAADRVTQDGRVRSRDAGAVRDGPSEGSGLQDHAKRAESRCVRDAATSFIAASLRRARGPCGSRPAAASRRRARPCAAGSTPASPRRTRPRG